MPDQDTQFTILNAARLVDGTGGPVAEAAAILLEGDTVRQIGTRETVRAPDGATCPGNGLRRRYYSAGVG